MSHRAPMTAWNSVKLCFAGGIYNKPDHIHSLCFPGRFTKEFANMSLFAIPSPCQEADQVNNRLNRALRHEATFLVKSLSLFLVSRAWGTAGSSQLSSPASTYSCPNHLLRYKSLCHFTGQKSFMAPHHLQNSLYLPGPLMWSPWFKPPSLSPELLQQAPNWLPTCPPLSTWPSHLLTTQVVWHLYSVQSFR